MWTLKKVSTLVEDCAKSLGVTQREITEAPYDTDLSSVLLERTLLLDSITMLKEIEGEMRYCEHILIENPKDIEIYITQKQSVTELIKKYLVTPPKEERELSAKAIQFERQLEEDLEADKAFKLHGNVHPV